MHTLERLRSLAIYEESCGCIPGGVNSPVRAFTSLGMKPLVVHRGEGSYIEDVDGNRYIDYCGSWGALILGHAHPAVVKAATDQLAQGSSFGISTPYELECALEIKKHFPSMEKMRFVSSGTEAVMSAIRLARGFTGKPGIVKFNGHYHGHSDSLLVQAGSGVSYLSGSSSQGVPASFAQHTASLPFNSKEALLDFLNAHDDIAAVILEPIAGNMGLVPGELSYMHLLREETKKRGILLIFDEVITGFRVGLTGAQGLYGISPDLTTLGKIIGGGFPAAAFGGKEEIMNLLAPLGPVYQAGTLSGNPVAMCAGLACLKELSAPFFYEKLEEKADFLLRPIEEKILKENLPITLNRLGSLFTLFFGVRKVHSREDLKELDHARFNHFFRTLFETGIYLAPSPYEASFISYAHTEEDLAKTQNAILSYLEAFNE